MGEKKNKQNKTNYIKNRRQNYTTIEKPTPGNNRRNEKKKTNLNKIIITLTASFIVHHQLSSKCNFWYSRNSTLNEQNLKEIKTQKL